MDSGSTQSQAEPGRRPRGRPRRDPADAQTRNRLVRSGLEVLTEKGFSATGVDEILRRARVPKGSFYHYFDSKTDFGAQLITAYADYFAAKLDRWFLDDSRSPIERIHAFIDDAKTSMARHDFRRGCLVGNLGQEMGALPEAFRNQLIKVFEDWQARTAACLRLAQDKREISPLQDAAALAAFFWIGWEGAVLRARLERSAVPLDAFAQGFFAAVRQKSED